MLNQILLDFEICLCSQFKVGRNSWRGVISTFDFYNLFPHKRGNINQIDPFPNNLAFFNQKFCFISNKDIAKRETPLRGQDPWWKQQDIEFCRRTGKSSIPGNSTPSSHLYRDIRLPYSKCYLHICTLIFDTSTENIICFPSLYGDITQPLYGDIIQPLQ